MAAPDRDAYLMDQFRALAARYEISEYFAGKLKQLEGQSRGGERNGERGSASLFLHGALTATTRCVFCDQAGTLL